MISKIQKHTAHSVPGLNRLTIQHVNFWIFLKEFALTICMVADHVGTQGHEFEFAIKVVYTDRHVRKESEALRKTQKKR